MALSQVKVKLASEGNLNIPSAITQQAGFSPDEEAIIILTDDGLFIRKEKRTFTADGALHTLLASGEIRFSDLGKGLSGNLLPDITLERIHAALAGISVPIEEIIHEERNKYEI